MNNDPRVSVIIATYNSSGSLHIALQSLLNQTFPDFEAWIIGDACTDDSEEVVASFQDERLNWFNRTTNSGSQGAPNNEGLERARGTYHAYLGHDDLWFPWHLAGLVSLIEETDADLVHPLCAMVSPGGLEGMVGPPAPGQDYDSHYVFPSAWLHHRRVVEKCGNWGDHLKLGRGVDHEFLGRIHRAGGEIRFCPQLSLLKFPSKFWRSYAPCSEPPQMGFRDSMMAHPTDLQHDLLFEAATMSARHASARVPVGEALLQLMRSVLRATAEVGGRDLGPLGRLWVWRFQRMRRKRRRDRGLAPLVPNQRMEG
ncbi:glycosyltransferase family 2 protein [Gemmatimonadota bacterium]